MHFDELHLRFLSYTKKQRMINNADLTEASEDTLYPVQILENNKWRGGRITTGDREKLKN